MNDIDDLKWLMENRSKIQSVLFQLYEFATGDSVLDPKQAAMLQFLTGATFSLWRAAFLTDSARRSLTVANHAKEFLLLLVKDNAINYTQESKTREWTVGYYLNNAYFRLQLAYTKLSLATSLSSAVDEFLRHQVGTNTPPTDLRRPWETAYEASLEIFGQVRSA